MVAPRRHVEISQRLQLFEGHVMPPTWAASPHGTASAEAPITAAQVDGLLWAAGQDKTGLPPYHRTRTVYY